MKHSLRLSLISLFVLSALRVSAFEDPSARNNKLLFEYIDQVPEAVGQAEFDRVPFSTLMSLARRLGQIERYHLSPKAFFAFAREAEAVREAYYIKRVLTDAEFEEYILPLRIRYESTARTQWRSFFRETFADRIRGLDAEEAAQSVLKSIIQRVTLDSEPTYTLGYRGDLDPLTTWRGRRGDEVDVSILACAALRSIGIPARLVYTPNIRGTRGGKVWLEYMNPEKEWRAWAPGFVKQSGWTDHRRALADFLKGRCGVIFATPANPSEVTDSYLPVRRMDFPAPGPESDAKTIEFNLAFEVDGFLKPIRGLELLSIRSTDQQRTIASDHYWSFTVEDDLTIHGNAR
ncbi:MAG: transglutaminase-like domain-containing protein [Kiritimatiellia bacterium]